MIHSLNIVCLDAPSPPDYGGAIDMFGQIKSLAESGIRIHLHYFSYKENRSTEGLENYCASIHRYPRKSFFSGVGSGSPFIVRSRLNKNLIDRLNQSEFPVLLQGIHCTGIIPHLKTRQIVVRLHNDEAAYYEALAETERNIGKRLYYKKEANLLRNYQFRLPQFIKFACISTEDIRQFSRHYTNENLHFIPAFHPWQLNLAERVPEHYCLYHGNLSVAENIAAVKWLVKEVFSSIDVPLIVAGKTPDSELKKLVTPFVQINLIADPSDQELDALIEGARINVLPSFNNTGIKLKLIHGLMKGRFCFTNSAGIEGTDIQNTMKVLDQAAEWRSGVLEYYKKDFSQDEREQRLKLAHLYDNRLNAEKLISLY